MFRKFLKVALTLLFLLSLLVVGTACSDKTVYKKKFPSISEIDYDPIEYVKIPELSSVRIFQKDLDAKVDYALISVLLQDAQYTLYSEAGTAKVSLYDIVNISLVGSPIDSAVSLNDDILDLFSKTSVNTVVGSGELFKMFSEEIVPKSEDLAEFEEQLLNIEVGNSKNITVSFPDDCSEPSLRNVGVCFTVTVNTISRPNVDMGMLTDDIILQRVGYDTVEAYRSYLIEYYLGDLAYDAVVKECEITAECQEILQIYVDKYIHQQILNSYGDELTEKEYNKAYEDVIKSSKDKAYAWAAPVTRERLILSRLFDVCEIELTEKEYQDLLEADWNSNKEKYKQTTGANSPEALEEYFGRDELELAYCFDELLKVLPQKITVE